MNLERLPAPAIAPPVNRKKPAAVHVELEARPVTGLLAEGIGYHYWTYNGTVLPGRALVSPRVCRRPKALAI